MLSRRLLTISLLLTGVSAYFVFFGEEDALLWTMGLGIAGALCSYIFQHQLNWWWYQRYPPAFPEEIGRLYLKNPNYAQLSEEDRQKFRTRASLFIEAKEFIPQGFETIAEEIKYIVGFYAILLTLHRDKFLFDPYDRVVIYLHPFLSPNYPDQIHICESEHEDGTIIFSLEHLNAGFMNPSQFYQCGMHLFGELYARKYLPGVQIENTPEVWAQLNEIGALSKDEIETFVGLPLNSPVPVMIHHWFARNDRMKSVAPAMHATVSAWLGLNGNQPD